MGQIIINYTDEQMKAMKYVVLSPEEWLQNCWDNRARQAIDEVIEDMSDRQPDKLPVERKIKIIKRVRIKTAAERQNE